MRSVRTMQACDFTRKSNKEYLLLMDIFQAILIACFKDI